MRDILDELTSRVGPLEKESEKAKKFLELAEQKKSLEVTLWADTLRRAKDQVRQAQREREIAQGDYDRATAEIEGVDAETESVRAEIEQLIIDIERYNGEIRSITEEIAGADASVAVLENDISHSRDSMQELHRQIEMCIRDRVQSVAVRLIVDRQKEIDAFVPEEYWNLDAQLSAPGSSKKFVARLAADTTGEKIEVTEKEQADRILSLIHI